MNTPTHDPHAWALERLEEYVAGGLTADDRTTLEAHAKECAACNHALHDLTEMDQTMQNLFSIARPAPDFENRIIARLWHATWRARLSTPTMKRMRFAVAASFILGSTGLFATFAVENDIWSNPTTRLLADSRDTIGPGRFKARLIQSVSGSDPTSFFADFGAAENSYKRVDVARPKMSKDDPVLAQRNAELNRRNNELQTGLDSAQTSIRKLGEELAPAQQTAGGVRYRYGLTVQDEATRADLGVIKPSDGPTTSGRIGVASGEQQYFKPGDTHGKRTVQAPTVTLYNGQRSYVVPGGQSLDISGQITDDFQMKLLRNATSTLSPLTKTGAGNLTINGGTVQAPNGGTLQAGGQTLAFGDTHLDFTKNPYIGQGGDSIWAFDGKPGTNKNTKADSFTASTSTSTPFDATAVPVRDANSNRLDGDVANAVADAVNKQADVRASQATLATSTPAAQQVAADRKVIRNGTMEFEVRNFDDAVDTISTVLKEEGGFVSGTNSEKLANGKVKGTIVVRVDPARLDRVVLKLRGLGELKTQQISAQDITKEYTDLESELRANRAMEDRLLDIIKTGKGSIKELVEAEKQLGVYREKIEKIEGEKRYYDNLVGLSTLSITLYEKDIQAAATAAQTENVNMSVEAEDVESKFADAKEAIEKDAGGRIIKAELRRFEASQLAAQIVCEVPADKADLLVARFKQLGRVAGLDRLRSQSTSGGTAAPATGVKVEQKATQISLALYNLANIAPRQTAVLLIAVPNVEEAYNKALSRVRQQIGAEKDGPARPTAGVVVTSNIAGQNADQMSADVRADVRATEAATVLADLRQLGEVMNSTLTENPDTANVTTSKEGISLRLVPIAAVPAREAQTLQLAAADVSAAYQKLSDAVRPLEGQKAGRILQSQLNQQDPRTITGTLEIDLRRADQATFETALAASGVDIVARNVTRSTDTASTLDTKVRYAITLTGADNLPARQNTIAGIEVEDVERASADLHAAIAAVHGKELDAGISKDAGGHMIGRIVAEVPLIEAPALQTKLQTLGKERTNDVSRNPQATDGPLARAHFEITLSNAEMLMPQDRSIGSTLRSAVAASLGTLLWSLYLIVNGLLVIGPFALVAWVAWKILKRKKAAQCLMTNV
jgi:hypothetical protein